MTTPLKYTCVLNWLFPTLVLSVTFYVFAKYTRVEKICIKIIDQIDKTQYFLLSWGFEYQRCDNKRSAFSKESYVLLNEVWGEIPYLLNFAIECVCNCVCWPVAALQVFTLPQFSAAVFATQAFRPAPRSFYLSLGFSHRRHCRSFLGFLLQRSFSVCCALLRGCTNRCF